MLVACVDDNNTPGGFAGLQVTTNKRDCVRTWEDNITTEHRDADGWEKYEQPLNQQLQPLNHYLAQTIDFSVQGSHTA